MIRTTLKTHPRFTKKNLSMKSHLINQKFLGNQRKVKDTLMTSIRNFWISTRTVYRKRSEKVRIISPTNIGLTKIQNQISIESLRAPMKCLTTENIKEELHLETKKPKPTLQVGKSLNSLLLKMGLDLQKALIQKWAQNSLKLTPTFRKLLRMRNLL